MWVCVCVCACVEILHFTWQFPLYHQHWGEKHNLFQPLQQQPLEPNCICVPGTCVPICGLPLRSAFSWRVPCCRSEISRTSYVVRLEFHSEIFFLFSFFASEDKHGHVRRNENKMLKPSMMVKWWLHWTQDKPVDGSSWVFAIALPPLALASVTVGNVPSLFWWGGKLQVLRTLLLRQI